MRGLVWAVFMDGDLGGSRWLGGCAWLKDKGLASQRIRAPAYDDTTRRAKVEVDVWFWKAKVHRDI